MQEWWGMNKTIQDYTDFFGQAGFRALTPDLYRGAVAKDKEHAGHLLRYVLFVLSQLRMSSISGLDWARAKKDIQGAAAYLKSLGCKKVGVVGFCMVGAPLHIHHAHMCLLSGRCFEYCKHHFG